MNVTEILNSFPIAESALSFISAFLEKYSLTGTAVLIGAGLMFFLFLRNIIKLIILIAVVVGILYFAGVI